MEHFAERLKSARKMKAWSLQELADAPGVSISKQALSKYELGEMKASGDVLIRLSRALEVKPDFFLRKSTIELSEVAFRKKPSLSLKEIDRIKEEVREYLERYLETERILNIETRFDIPAADMSVRQPNEVDRPALALLKKWKLGLNPIPNVIEMLEENGVKVVIIDAPDDFDGLSTKVNGIPVVVISKHFSVERKRFTALHELGHIVLEIDDDADAEAVCNAFAGAMLLPDSSLEKLIGDKRNNIAPAELVSIKEQFGISAQAIMMRAYLKGIINDAAKNKFFRWLGSNKKEADLGRYQGEEKSYRFKHLLFRLAAEEVVSMSKAANLAGVSLATFRNDFNRGQ